jgi:hypothetical protein
MSQCLVTHKKLRGRWYIHADKLTCSSSVFSINFKLIQIRSMVEDSLSMHKVSYAAIDDFQLVYKTIYFEQIVKKFLRGRTLGDSKRL